ncbi:integrin beta-like protein 1 [Thrips palmi]|uniref:Integrin beta-like protein 1 n=1 Tax=Thrips palmi TaxID=161013 RepID=A0A6P8ZPX4_THRPL|nr:integrin beta-like protein 1 [Thrips palmi]
MDLRALVAHRAHRAWAWSPRLAVLVVVVVVLLEDKTVAGQRFGHPQHAPGQSYPQQGYHPQHQGYNPQQGYPQQGYNPQQGFPQQGFPQQGYNPQQGPQGGFGRPAPGPGLQGPGYPSFGLTDEGLGSPCSYDENCYSMEHTYCKMQQSCECKLNYVPSEAGDRCLATVGAACSYKYDCSGLGAEADCLQNVCDCGGNYLPAPDGTHCLKGAERMNEECLLDLQCEPLGQGAVCTNGKCTCKMGWHENQQKCVPTRELGEPCTQDGECATAKNEQGVVVCHRSTRTCQCQQNYVEREGGVCSGAGKVNNVIAMVILALHLLYIIS